MMFDCHQTFVQQSCIQQCWVIDVEPFVRSLRTWSLFVRCVPISKNNRRILIQEEEYTKCDEQFFAEVEAIITVIVYQH